MRGTKVSSARTQRGGRTGRPLGGKDDLPPHRYLVASCRRAGETIREWFWDQPLDGAALLVARATSAASNPDANTR